MGLVGREILTLTIKPTADVAANVFVGFDDNTCAANTKAKGISRAAFKAGDIGDAIALGTAYITLAATLAAGAAVTSDAAGKAVAAAANPVNGHLLEGGNAADVVEMLVVP